MARAILASRREPACCWLIGDSRVSASGDEILEIIGRDWTAW